MNHREHEAARRLVWANAVAFGYALNFRNPDGAADDVLDAYDKKFPDPIPGEQYLKQQRELQQSNEEQSINRNVIIEKLKEHLEYDDLCDTAEWVVDLLLKEYSIIPKE